MSLVEELTWRGMIHQMMPGTEDLLNKEKVTGYLGTDPTADSLHVGNMASLMMLVHLQRHGHQPLALVGGATGMVGDPSGRSTERQLLTEEQLAHNIAGMKKDMAKVLDFDLEENPALIVNNYDWFKDMTVLDFLRNVGKHLTVNYMMAKDSVKNRMESGISFTEFSYQLIQGYDFYHLWKNYNCKVQFGGSDQWGNIVSGTELIRRIDGGEAWAITCPLILKADGSKFGKSAGGAVWLNAEKTSPYKFYQYWKRATDADAPAFIRKFTLLSKEEIEALEVEQAERPGILQLRLAQEVTTMIHGKEACEKAIATSGMLFGKGSKEALLQLDAGDFSEVFEGVPTFDFARGSHGDQLGVIDFLSEHTGILPSKSEARRSLEQNSISINMEKVGKDYEISATDLIHEKYILVQKGKKNQYLVVVS